MIYYGNDDREYIYPLSYWKEVAKDNNDNITVELYKIELGRDVEKWCKKYNKFIYSKKDCGMRNCKDYYPCNGKNGRCCYLQNGFISTGEYYVVSPKGRIRREK